MSSADCSISSRNCRSRCIDDLGGGEDFVTAEVVEAGFEVGAGNQVDVAVEEGFEFGLDLVESGEGEVGAGVELHEDVDVAVGAKVGAKDGAEKGKFGDLPPLAEFGDLWEGQRGNGHGGLTNRCFYCAISDGL